METRSKQWQDVVQPNCQKLKLYGYMGMQATLSPKSCEAEAALLAEMANKLDLSHDMICDLNREIASLRDKLNKVTLEGNNV